MLVDENESADKEKNHVVDFCKWNCYQHELAGQHVQDDHGFIIEHLIIDQISCEKRCGGNQQDDIVVCG